MKAIVPALSRALTASAASLHAFSRFAGALALVVPLAASAATFTWSGAGTGGDLGAVTATTNWTGGITPLADGLSIEDIVFGTATGSAQSIFLPNGLTLHDLTFNSSTAYTFSGTPATVAFTLTGDILATGGGAVTLNNSVGLVLKTDGTDNAHTVNAANGVTVTVNGVVSEASGADPANLVKTGGGTLVLSGANTFTGKTTINSGYISIAADSGLGAAPGTVVADQLTLNGGALATTASFALNANRGLTLGASGGALNINSGTTLTYNGVVAGSGKLDINPLGGTLALGGNNTYSGVTTVYTGGGGTTLTISHANALGDTTGNTVVQSGATLNINGVTTPEPLSLTGTGVGNAGALTGSGTTAGASGAITLADNTSVGVVSGTTLTLSGVIDDGPSSYQLTKVDSGTLVLSGANTYSGATAVTQGTLKFGADNTLPAATGVSVSSGATLDLNNYNGTIAALGGSGVVDLTASSASKTLTVGDSSSSTFSGVIQNSGTGSTLALTKTGSGTLTLSGANTYTGKTTVNGGALSISAQSGLGGNPASLTADQLTLNGGTLKTSATLSLSDTNRGVTLGSSGGTFDVATGTTLVIDDVIAGTGPLTKTGTGTLTLTGTNTYSGVTTVSRGTLAINASAPSGTNGPLGNATSAIVLNDSNTSSNATSLLTGLDAVTIGRAITVANSGTGTTTIGSSLTSGTAAFSGAITLDKSATLKASGTTTVTFSGVIGSSGGISKSGTGTVILSGANTYSGSTSINQGTLTLSGAGTLGNGTGSLTVSGGTLDLGTLSRGSGAVSLTTGGTIANGTLTGTSYTGQSGTISASLAGSGAFTKSTSGTVTLSGDNSLYSGSLTASSGAINLASANARGTGAWTFNSFSALTLGTAGTLSGSNAVTTTFNSSAQLNAQANGAITGGAQTFNGSSVLNANASNSITGGQQTFSSTASTPAELDANHVNAISGGTQTFSGATSLQVTASGVLGEGGITGAITGGHQIFNDTAFLKAHTDTVYSISGGTQDFYNGAALVASGPHMISDGSTQYFHGAVGEDASIPVFPSGVTTSAQFVALDATPSGQTTISNFLKTTPRLTINGSGSVDGGTQYFTGNSSLQANIGGGLQGGTQYFSDFSHLRASKQDSVIGGSQSFSGNAFLWASTGYAVTGGSQHFTGSSGAYANATHSISGVTLNLAGNSFISIGADNALDTSTEIYFSGSAGGIGGTLTLNGHPVAVGEIRSGATTVNPGIIQNGSSTAATLTVGVDSESTFDLADETPNFSGQIKNGLAGEVPAAALSFTKNGSGTLVLSGTNTYTGATSINAGTLEIAQPSALPSASAIVFNGDGGVLQLDSASIPSSEILNYTVGSIAGTDSGSVISLPASTSLTTSANTDTTFAGAILGTTSSSLIKGGTGALTLTGVNYYGQTVIDAGSVVIGTTNALRTGNSESSSLGHDVTINSSGALVVSNDQTIRALSGSGAVQLGAGKTLTVNLPDGGAGSTSTFSGTFSGNTGTLKKDGPGTLTLAGASSHFFGATTLSSGILQLANTNALAGSTVTYTGGTLDFGSLTSVVLGGLAGSHDLALTAPLNVGGNEQDTTYSGVFTGSQSLTKDGDGALTLTGSSSSYTGAVIVNNGTLALGNGGTSGGFSPTSNVTVNLGATLINNRSDDISFSGALSGAGTIKKQGSGIFEITSNNPSFTGMAQISQGGLRLIGAGGFGGATVSVFSTGQLSGNGTVGALTVNNGGSIAPASATSPIGTLNAGATAFGTNGHFAFDLKDATGAPGAGWDLMSVSALNLTATSGNPFVIDLTSINSSGVAGNALNFSATLNYTFAIVNSQSVITGFDTNAFLVNTAAFSNPIGTGVFGLSLSGDSKQLLLNFTPVPEPSTWALMLSGLGVLALGARRRLRRR